MIFSSGNAYRNYVLAVLFFVYAFNMVDRQILAILLPPIKQDLQLSDTQLGFLSGLAFALFYTTMGLPIARLADRSNRRNIIGFSLVLWSAMTALCGFAANFFHLFLCRVGVGVGEAGATPPSHSLLADYFPPQKRAMAFAIHSTGISAGIIFGFAVGGWVSELYGWRWAFFIVGLPGILLALILFATVREPVRGYAENRLTDDSIVPLRQLIPLLLQNRPFVHLCIASGLQAYMTNGMAQWFPSFLNRSYGLSQSEIGLKMGLIIGLAGMAGTLISGALADVAGRHDKRWYMWICGLSVLISAPAAIVMLLSESVSFTFILLGFIFFLNAFFFGPAYATAQLLVPMRMRAMASAILLFASNILGIGLGPQIVGITSDIFTPHFGQESLRYALLLSVAITFWSAFHYMRAAKHLRSRLAF